MQQRSIAEDAFQQHDQAGQHRGEKKSLRAKAVEELIKFLILFAYLWIIFLVFFVHEWIVLAHNHIGFRFYGLAAINSLVLAKIMLIAEDMRFTKVFERGSLVSPIAYKSALFSVLLISAYLLEEVVVGAFRGKVVAESFPRIGDGTAWGILAVAFILCLALVPFFAFREMARVMGPANFRALIFKGAANVEPIPVVKISSPRSTNKEENTCSKRSALRLW
jgi:hypothetical protein